ncbi:MAG: cytochrome P460 family protein [Longimicrobiales bacterium]
MNRLHCVVVVAVLGAAACAPDEEPRVEPVDDPAQQPQAVSQAADTTAASLWAHLQRENYRTWPLYPGKGELYTGTEPHGMLLTTYVNRIAHDALSNGAGSMPAGAIIVKENYMPDSTFDAATVMHKVPGYNPQNGDWFWVKYDANGVAEEGAGRAAMCQQCHAAARPRDFLMTAQQGN